MTPKKTFKWKWYSLEPRERLIVAAGLLFFLLYFCWAIAVLAGAR